jgi:hypothetical protein
MRRPRKPFLFLLFVPLALSAQSKTLPGFAVVELFTSEGCSSCPPADEALSQLVRRADREKLPIYALEWHVDYWDYLGWRDPWDSRLATERQYTYARTLPSSVYTPQAVINGYAVPRNAGDLGELEADARLAAAAPAAKSLSGRIIDNDGKPVSGVRVRACSETLCVPATTGADGYFALDSLPAGSDEVDFDLPAPGAAGARVQFLQRPVTVRIMRTVWRVRGGGDGGPIPLSPSVPAQP